MTTFTKEKRDALIKYLATHGIVKGLGTKESACSLAAINLAISGELTDDIPQCMSLIIGRWLIPIQDAIPDKMRNSTKYKSLLVESVGTGRDSEKEKERLALVLKWMWEVVLPELSPLAKTHGYEKEWQAMLVAKDSEAAYAAGSASFAASYANAAYDASSYVARAATYAASAASNSDDYAASSCAADSFAADSFAYDAASSCAAAASAASTAVSAASSAEFWDKVNPLKVIEDLIAI